MLVVAANAGHDGAIAAIKDGELLFSLESEKDSSPRHRALTPTTLLQLVEHLEETPDVVALGGWLNDEGAGYRGAHAIIERSMKMMGREVRFFSSSHERSHIMMGAGMAPPDHSQSRAVLVWEGGIGAFYLLDQRWSVTSEIPVLEEPGGRFAFLFAIADPSFPAKGGRRPRLEDSGKLMALAAFGNPETEDPAVVATVERILSPDGAHPYAKNKFQDSPIYNAGVEAQQNKDAAALLTKRLFETYATVAQERLPPGIPLYISGGCGLNCDWNTQWRDLGHFSSVFVPPCANDAGSALGTAIDAFASVTGDPRISWDVYSGLEFEWDCEPDTARWQKRRLDHALLVDALNEGHIVAWVQGRWEMGPRALGNRSILAEPFNERTRDRLNEIKRREGYRPIAPCCRLEDAAKVFDSDFEDPFMLYFRRVTSGDLGAVTHVDGTVRAQTVTRKTNEPLYDLLSVFAERHGVGVLCNTSLNFKGKGFINRMSDLVKYCENRGLDDIVVGETWFSRVAGQD